MIKTVIGGVRPISQNDRPSITLPRRPHLKREERAPGLSEDTVAIFPFKWPHFTNTNRLFETIRAARI